MGSDNQHGDGLWAERDSCKDQVVEIVYIRRMVETLLRDRLLQSHHPKKLEAFVPSQCSSSLQVGYCSRLLA